MDITNPKDEKAEIDAFFKEFIDKNKIVFDEHHFQEGASKSILFAALPDSRQYNKYSVGEILPSGAVALPLDMYFYEKDGMLVSLSSEEYKTVKQLKADDPIGEGDPAFINHEGVTIFRCSSNKGGSMRHHFIEKERNTYHLSEVEDLKVQPQENKENFREIQFIKN